MADTAYANAVRAQAVAANPEHSAWVSANAGSGKTKVLIDRVARLLLRGAAPDSILCVTYTKAAANEMLLRLFERLGSWSVMDEAKLRKELVDLEGRQNSPHSDDEIRRARALFARAVETPGGLRIETIHAFCARVLRRFPLEARIAPGFSEVDDVEAAQLWEQALREGILQINAADPKTLDTVSQAGGGFGALGGISAIRSNPADIARAAALSDDHLEASLKQALGAPDAAEEDLIGRAMQNDLPEADLKEAAARLEGDGKRDSLRTAKAIRATLATDDPSARWSAYAKGFFGAKGDLFSSLFNAGARNSPLIPALFETKEVPQGSEVLRILELDRQLKAVRLFQRSFALIRLARPILKKYSALKRANAAIDFDDLIALTRALLTRSATAEWVLYKLDGGLSHVLLDEAQDTSPDQWELLNALLTEFFSGQGVEKPIDPRTLFVVGDEKQSIYSFQGADPAHFLTERQSFEAKSRAAFGKAELPDMAMSFRSCPEILRFVDQVSESGEVDGHPFIEGPIGDFDVMRHTAFRGDQAGSVELWPIDVPEPLDEAVPWDAPLDTQSAGTPKSRLAKDVASQLAAIIDRGESVWSGGKQRPAEAGDILILVQNRQGGLFDALIAALKAEGLPVAGADRLVLADHIGVQDCLNLMRFALLPEDDLTLAEILRGPFADLVDDNEHLFKLAYDRGDATLWQQLKYSDHPDHQHAARFLERVLSLRHLPPYEFLSGLLECPDTNGETGWQRLTARLGRPTRDPVSALLSRAMAHDASGPSSLQTFVSAMDLDRTEIKRDLAAPNGNVRIMTVHGAKGLQAPIVVLPDLTRRPQTRDPAVLKVDGLPVWAGASAGDIDATAAARQAIRARQLREHRRLLYVALTRAEDRLILAGHWSGQRPKPDKAPGPGFADGSWYALCAEAMETLTGKSISDGAMIRFGDAPVKTAATGRASTRLADAPDWLWQGAKEETSIEQIVAASALKADRTPVLPPADSARAERLKRGRLIHALLERLPEYAAEERRRAGATFLARDKSLEGPQCEEMLEAAMSVLEDERFAEVFAPGGRAEAPIIGTGEGLPTGQIINGRVDRLVVADDKVLIVDFKTDRPAPVDVHHVSKAYLAQMAAYRAVLQSAYTGRVVEAALVWTDGPVLMPLPADLLVESLSL